MNAAIHETRRTGLRTIALFEAGKGLLALLAAGGLEVFGPAPLQHGLNQLILHLHLDPDRGVFGHVLKAVDPSVLHLAAAFGVAYALIRLAEAWGLWMSRRWASWLGCLGAAIYLPLDALALLRHPGVMSVTALVVNLLLIAYLARDINRRPPPP